MTDTTALFDRLTTLRRTVETQATHALDRALDRVGLVRKTAKKKRAAPRPAARAKRKQA